MKVVLNPQYQQFSAFVESIHFQFEKGGDTIYKQRNEIRVFDVNGFLINVKRFKVPHLLNRIVYTFFRSSKAQRSYQYATKLIKMGIETPMPLAFILTKQNGLIHFSYFISCQADCNRNMYEFGKGGIEGREHILQSFAAFTSELHEKGVYHKDYSPGNILFKEVKGEVRFSIVDINRMRFGAVSISRGCANFARLWGQRSFFECIIRRYAEIRQADPDRCLSIALRERHKFWKNYARKRQLPFDL